MPGLQLIVAGEVTSSLHLCSLATARRLAASIQPAALASTMQHTLNQQLRMQM